MRKSIGILVVLIAAAVTAREAGLFSVLKSDAAIGKQPGGFYLLPTNQLLQPWGEQALIPGRPVDLAYDSGKRVLAILNWRSVLLMDGSSGAQLAEIKTRSTSYTGLAFRPGDRELWASETTRTGPDSLIVIPLSETGAPGTPARIELEGHPLPAGIAFSPDGGKAFVAFSRNNTLAVIDTESRTVEREIAVGMAPYAVAVSAKHRRIYVSNRGGRRPSPADTVAPSSGSNVLASAKTGASASGTVSAIDSDYSVREAEVGLAPSNLTLSTDEAWLAVANSHSDNVSLLDSSTLARTDLVIPAWPEGAGVIGSQPVAVKFGADDRTLFVACGGTNAIVVAARAGAKWSVAGALPTGWFPSAVTLGPEGALRVLNIKGVGNTADKKGAFNSRQYEGSLLRIPAPPAARLAAGTREVRAANSPKFEPAGGVQNLESLGIRHVVFVIKENRTYDQVFGDIGKGNGDPKLALYGKEITPNHHALAERYVLLDNFHTGGAISFDGHQWLMQAFVSDYVERAFAASPRGYAWNMADALAVSPAGFFWQSATRPLEVRIYGEFCLPARWDPAKQNAVDINQEDIKSWSDYWRLYKEGRWQSSVGSRSGVPAMQPYIDPRYPNSSTMIPDQLRADEFLRELGEFEKAGRMPNLLIATLNSDHTNGTRPGSPTPRAMVAENDLAMGRMVEGLSKSRFWSQMLILVVEDDAQDGLDHVDGHRTVALAIGPNVRRGAVDSNHYNHTSMVRTIQDIFRIPPKTRFLTTARAMTSVFTAEKDVKPYECVPAKVALDEMNPPLKALRGRQLWAARQSLAMNWSEPDDIPQDVLNRILWWDAKGWNAAYPKMQ